MKLAVRKDTSGTVPMGGFHYMLHPLKMDTGFEANLYQMMGYITIEVEQEKGQQLLEAAREALAHQMEVAILTEAALIKSEKVS